MLRSNNAPDKPIVSVVLPTFARFKSGRLSRAIESILTQTFTDFELIVVDDGSTDGSHDFIERCRAHDPRIIHVRHQLNSGLPALRVNEGIELARGKFVAFQFDDDNWRPNALQALIAAATAQPKPALIVGHCLVRHNQSETVLPDRELKLFVLYETNLIANNSVLVPRSLFDRGGMLDCHVGLRRLCDWDLWLRFARFVPFVVIDEVISDAEAALLDSIGMTVRRDLPLTRWFQSVSRDRLLTPQRWRDYQVDSLRIGDVEVVGAMRRRLYEGQIVPYYLKHRHDFPQIENFPTMLPGQRKSLVYTSEWYADVLHDILNRHNEVSSGWNDYQLHWEHQSQLSPQRLREANMLLMVRSVERSATDLLRRALNHGVPCAYFLDDDFLALHECGSEFAHLTPGQPARATLEELLKRADAVWVSSRAVRESVQPLNPRAVAYNGSVATALLPQTVRPRETGRALRIGCTSHSYRREELAYLWPALVRFSQEYGDKISFEFWGVDVSGLPALSSPVKQRPFIESYTQYLDQLREAEFDIFLAPLLDHPRARLAKAPNKYYLAAVTAALAIFSDVQPYEELPGELTCLKTENSVAGWYRALCRAAEMPPREFDLMRARMLAHVRETFTEQAETNTHQAALSATEFHARTRSSRSAEGRPRILFYCSPIKSSSAARHLLERIRMVRSYGLKPVTVFEAWPSSMPIDDALFGEMYALPPRHDESESQLKEIVDCVRPAVVHSNSLSPVLARLCWEFEIPHVSSLADFGSKMRWRAGFAYSDLLEADTLDARQSLPASFGRDTVCRRGGVAKQFFDIGMRRHLESIGSATTLATANRIVAFAENTQPESIEAFSRICQTGIACTLEIICDDRSSPHVSQLKRVADRLNAAINWEDDAIDVAGKFLRADILLATNATSFPDAVKEAMAAGVLVVADKSAGIGEIVIDQVTGITSDGLSALDMEATLRRALMLSPDQRAKIVDQARRVARSEFHPSRAAHDLLSVYNRAIGLARERPSPMVEKETQPAKAKQREEFWIEPARLPQGHILISKGVQFSIVPRQSKWAGLDVMVGTHMQRVNGRLCLQIRSRSGKLIREAVQDLLDIADNEWAAFNFDAIAEAAKQTFILEFRLDARDRNAKVSIYAERPLENRVLRMLRRMGLQSVRSDLHCRMRYAV